MIAFIDDQREAHGVEPICKVLPIAPSTYHDHAAKRTNPEKRSERAKRDTVLQADIQRVLPRISKSTARARSGDSYGARAGRSPAARWSG
jgi:hypothetical protein